MFSFRTWYTSTAAACMLAAGCQSQPLMGGLFPLRDKTFAASKPAAYPVTYPATVLASPNPEVVTTPYYLNPGAEIHWQAQTTHAEPGQVTQGTGMIGPDGTVVLGPYGTCKVGGLALDRASRVVEQHLATYLDTPMVRLSAVVPTDQPAVIRRADVAWRNAPVDQNPVGSVQPYVTTSSVRQATWGPTPVRQPEAVVSLPEGAPTQASGQIGDGSFLRRVFSKLGFGQQ